jgi:hypothetical protein
MGSNKSVAAGGQVRINIFLHQSPMPNPSAISDTKKVPLFLVDAL